MEWASGNQNTPNGEAIRGILLKHTLISEIREKKADPNLNEILTKKCSPAVKPNKHLQLSLNPTFWGTTNNRTKEKYWFLTF